MENEIWIGEKSSEDEQLKEKLKRLLKKALHNHCFT